ncbi:MULTISPECIES: hypothetical protein [unclassified Polaribacter]|uniref:hypothetical protein n=1 Tax=unclassified Polaribacter TaxID=196858 RepID=UPI0011BFC6B6|nr:MULTISPECIES: hypothetical protein [unclassified Polaribacter]TXD51699.1 hypothetical protein ES043_10820 [Polaribacter sp. IC063]TXD59550.1 hypothetical protein ES044_09760 [Polaribacter sp. IC066]
MSKELLSNDIILGYRNLIEERYQYKDLKEKYDFPETIDEKVVNDIKIYFLTYIYPDLEKRAELNEAFNTLDDFIKYPEKLLNLVVDSLQLLFTHGRHLPKIFNAGLKAMKSFRGATKFEKTIVLKAIQENSKPPFTTLKINKLIQLLPYKELEEFMKNTETFFNIIYDKELVEKIKEIISFILTKMKNKPKIFSKKEIIGLSLALETISKGEEMLNKLTLKDQEILIGFVLQIEKDCLQEIFSK